MDQEIRKGIKTFFLNADSSLSPDESQMQALFLAGFEVYPLPETRLVPVADQVACLSSLFKEMIVFFNVESELPEGTWPQLLSHLAEEHGDRLRMGVVHHEADAVKRAELERVYLMEAHVQAGCIFVDQHRSPDLARLHRVLVANQANGRRKAIRMLCTGRFNFVKGKQRLEGRVTEISISHFLCTFREGDPHIEEGTRLNDVQFMVGGPVLHIDAAVMIKRIAGHDSSEMVYVCGFMKKGKGEMGLDPANLKTIIRLIHSYCNTQVNALVQAAFQKRWKENVFRSSPAR